MLHRTIKSRIVTLCGAACLGPSVSAALTRFMQLLLFVYYQTTVHMLLFANSHLIAYAIPTHIHDGICNVYARPFHLLARDNRQSHICDQAHLDQSKDSYKSALLVALYIHKS